MSTYSLTFLYHDGTTRRFILNTQQRTVGTADAVAYETAMAVYLREAGEHWAVDADLARLELPA